MENSNNKKSDIAITTKKIDQFRKRIDSIDRKIIIRNNYIFIIKNKTLSKNLDLWRLIEC